MSPILICCRCLRPDDDETLVNPNTLVCIDCLTDEEVREELRADGIEPEGLAERIFSKVYASLINRGNTEAAEGVAAILDRLQQKGEGTCVG